MKSFLNIKDHWLVIILLSLSLVTHLLFFGYPKEVVFDEVYFPTYASTYLTGEYHFDPHPPFSKLVYAFVAQALGLEPSTMLSIGDPMPEGWVLIRLLPLIAGILLPLIIYRLCREWGLSSHASFFAGALVIFETSLLVQSRFMLLDSLLLFFGFLGLLLYFIGRNRNIFWIKVLAAIAFTFTFSTKWTGGSFIFIALLVEMFGLIKNYSFKKLAQIIFLFFILPLIIYMGIFAIHFKLLDKSGQGDPFMTEDFQKTLIGNPNHGRADLRDIGFVEKFLELNVTMFDVNARFDAAHPYGSEWYTWPVMKRTIFYWEDDGSYIYLFGNIFIYLLSLCSMIILTIIYIVRRSVLDKKLTAFVIFGFILNLLPFMGIGRVMFLYHYHPALVFAIISSAILLDLIPTDHKKFVSASLIIISISFYIYFLPLIYGLEVPADRMPKLFLIDSWR